MSSNLIQVQFGPCAPDDLPGILRELAGAAERGEVTGMVYAYIRDDSYQTGLSASIAQSLCMTTILHKAAVRQLTGE